METYQPNRINEEIKELDALIEQLRDEISKRTMLREKYKMQRYKLYKELKNGVEIPETL